MTLVAARTAPRRRLLAELLAFYVAGPVALATLLPPAAMWPGLFAMAALGLVLLHRTPGFVWSDLLQAADRISWRLVATFGAATVAVSAAVLWLTGSGTVFGLARANPAVMALIAAFYPFVSALPQELIFRPLFFRRYGGLLPGGARAQVVLNAALFSLAHLMYWSWIVAAMTFAGGIVFAVCYRMRRNFPEAVVLHALGGIIVFLMGLGAFFYSGNVTRPF